MGLLSGFVFDLRCCRFNWFKVNQFKFHIFPSSSCDFEKKNTCLRIRTVQDLRPREPAFGNEEPRQAAVEKESFPLCVLCAVQSNCDNCSTLLGRQSKMGDVLKPLS